MKLRYTFCSLFLLLVLSIVLAPALAVETVTVTGTVTDDYLLIDDNGAVYVISGLEKGEELLGHVGRRVKVTGKVQDEVDGPVIEVKRFEVISD